MSVCIVLGSPDCGARIHPETPQGTAIRAERFPSSKASSRCPRPCQNICSGVDGLRANKTKVSESSTGAYDLQARGEHFYNGRAREASCTLWTASHAVSPASSQQTRHRVQTRGAGTSRLFASMGLQQFNFEVNIVLSFRVAQVRCILAVGRGGIQACPVQAYRLPPCRWPVADHVFAPFEACLSPGKVSSLPA